MWNKKNKKKNQRKFSTVPFSKKNIIYARLEAYAFSLILIFMVWHEKDVSAIAIILSLAWAGYRAIQGLYINMAKHEHLMDKKIEYKKLGLDFAVVDEELSEIESEEINIEIDE